MSEDAELDLLIEHRELNRAFLDAKAAYQADPGNEAKRAAKLAAGEELRAHRAYWRNVRDYLKHVAETADGDAVAHPDVVSLNVEGHI